MAVVTHNYPGVPGIETLIFTYFFNQLTFNSL